MDDETRDEKKDRLKWRGLHVIPLNQKLGGYAAFKSLTEVISVNLSIYLSSYLFLYRTALETSG